MGAIRRYIRAALAEPLMLRCRFGLKIPIGLSDVVGTSKKNAHRTRNVLVADAIEYNDARTPG
ncbi:MAG: hypothetical protein A49_26750 [Methyloceanibacter sp.]|nr:MAG: hypothetical protein A49_26750 [Methyloceanibacter sp.]